MKKVTVHAPATVANVCCGFDLLGFAVQAPADEVTIGFRASPGVVMEKIEGDHGRLPLDPSKNTASVAVSALLNAIKSTQGFSIQLVKRLPLGSGMGSSAASAVAALVGANELLGRPFSRENLVVHAMEAERIACGAAHADNVAPSLLGGFVLIRDYAALDFIKLPAVMPLYCTLIHPHMEIKTADSRKILRKTLSLKDSLTQSGNLAALMIGLIQKDATLISKSLVDVIAEPARSVFIPGFDRIRAEVKAHGALGLGISGSGPTLFVLSLNEETAHQAGRLTAEHFRKANLSSDVFVSTINQDGAVIH